MFLVVADRHEESRGVVARVRGPRRAARSNGVSPSLLRRVASAPFSRSSAAQAAWPLAQAAWSGVDPSSLWRFASAPSSRSAASDFAWPLKAARVDGVASFMERPSTSAPARSRTWMTATAAASSAQVAA